MVSNISLTSIFIYDNSKTIIIAIGFFFIVYVDEGTDRQFVVYKADMDYKGFREYHQRIQTFLLWYIDAALFIDLDDEQWQYFNL